MSTKLELQWEHAGGGNGAPAWLGSELPASLTKPIRVRSAKTTTS